MKVVFTAAVMDLCHKGHINLMKEMRKEAGQDGKVVVILHDDKSIYDTKGKVPIQSLDQRVANVKIVGLADFILTCGDYKDLASKIQFVLHSFGLGQGTDFLFMRGNDWPGKFPARDTLEAYNIPIKFIEYTKGISSTFLREQLEDERGI